LIWKVGGVDESKCRGKDLVLTKEEMGIMKDCAAEVGFKGKDVKDILHAPCFIRCCMIKKGLVSIQAA
jgi:hypothetical protein